MGDEADFFVVDVGFGGLEKSTSEDSLSEEVGSDDEESAVAALADALSDDEGSEEESDVISFARRVSLADLVPDMDVPDEDESAFALGGAWLDLVLAEAFFSWAFVSFDWGDFAAVPEASSDSDSELDPEVSLELAFRFKFLTRFPTVGLFVAAVVGNFGPAGSSSSSASLSELEREVDDAEAFLLAAFVAFLFSNAGVPSFSSMSTSLPSLLVSLLPLLLVSSFAFTIATASSLALVPALACLFAFFDLLASLVSELSSESLLLVSSICVFSSYSLYHSL